MHEHADAPLLERAEARAIGAVRYRTGRPCKHGHLAERWTSTAICVECNKIHWANASEGAREKNRQRAKRHGAKNRSVVIERVKQWRLKNPERHKSNKASYRQRNKAACRLANAKWRASRPDYFREYEKANPDKRAATKKAVKARRRARMAQAEGIVSPSDIRRIKKQQGGRCGYCKTRLGKGYHADHIVPLALGGNNHRSNIQLLCGPCNLRKGAKHPLEYARQIGLLL